jgi:hypothetical protein
MENKQILSETTLNTLKPRRNWKPLGVFFGLALLGSTVIVSHFRQNALMTKTRSETPGIGLIDKHVIRSGEHPLIMIDSLLLSSEGGAQIVSCAATSNGDPSGKLTTDGLFGAYLRAFPQLWWKNLTTVDPLVPIGSLDVCAPVIDRYNESVDRAAAALQNELETTKNTIAEKIYGKAPITAPDRALPANTKINNVDEKSVAFSGQGPDGVFEGVFAHDKKPSALEGFGEVPLDTCCLWKNGDDSLTAIEMTPDGVFTVDQKTIHGKIYTIVHVLNNADSEVRAVVFLDRKKTPGDLLQPTRSKTAIAPVLSRDDMLKAGSLLMKRQAEMETIANQSLGAFPPTLRKLFSVLSWLKL